MPNQGRWSGSRVDALPGIIRDAVEAAGGWLSFDRFMALALYEPGLGYYANATAKFGRTPTDGSDFVTAPELSPWFGRALAVQVAEALQATGTSEVWEFGAGSGALAHQVLSQLETMGVLDQLKGYRILDVSGVLRERQKQTLAGFGDRVEWVDRWPQQLDAVLLGNEVLDAMPVQLLVRKGGIWHERGVGLDDTGAAPRFVWSDRPTALRPPVGIPGDHDYLTEIHPQAEAFVRSLAQCWRRGAGFFIDYGFPEAEYYHPQRHMGTLMCHQGHRSDPDPLVDVGLKDITAHVNFTAMALAAQEAGLQVMGYASQGRFLINCGLLDLAQGAPVSERTQLTRLIQEHEMGELFKVLALAPQASADGWLPRGFAQGDRTHTL